MSIPNSTELIRLGLIRPKPISDDASLAEARTYVRDRLDVGTDCPCCGQYARRYVRKINSSMARVLIRLCGLSLKNMQEKGEPWVSIKRLESVSREVSKLAYWGLVETKPHTPDKQKHSGLWKLTNRGIEFSYGRARVPSHAVLFNNELERLEGDLVAIWEALGQKFDYLELMAEVPGFSGSAVKSA